MSVPGYGPGEVNVGGMPMSHLALIARRNLPNVHSSAASAATEELGRALSALQQRGLASSTAGNIDRNLVPIMMNALQPLADHVIAIGARWLLVLPRSGGRIW